MEEDIRKKIIEIIRNSINEVVYDEVKKIPQRLKEKQEEFQKTKAQREQDAHDALFGKKDEEMSYRLNLREGNKPKITNQDLEQFEQEFKSKFEDISFDKQNKFGQNGQIVDFSMKNGQKDAFTSGKIIMNNNVLGFTMSLLNGFKIKSIIKDGIPVEFEIRNDTKDVFSKILNLYEEVFKKRFNEIINPIGGEDSMASPEPEAPAATPTPAAAPAAAPATETPPAI